MLTTFQELLSQTSDTLTGSVCAPPGSANVTFSFAAALSKPPRPNRRSVW